MKAFIRLIKNPFFQTILLTITYLLLASWVVYYSLGYKINWTTHKIQQTSILNINSNNKTLNPEVFINGKSFGKKLPVRVNYLFPDTYSVELKKAGYQAFKLDVELQPNRVFNLDNLILVKTNPKVEELDPNTFIDKLNKTGIHLNGYELWVDDNLITRSSENILNASWFPDNEHLVYQAGKTVWLLDVQANITQKITDLTIDVPLNYGFAANGKQFIYQEDGKIKAVTLFD